MTPRRQLGHDDGAHQIATPVVAIAAAIGTWRTSASTTIAIAATMPSSQQRHP